jgi:hypothetical protein
MKTQAMSKYLLSIVAVIALTGLVASAPAFAKGHGERKHAQSYQQHYAIFGDRRPKTEDRSPKSEVRSPKSEVLRSPVFGLPTSTIDQSSQTTQPDPLSAMS